MFRINNYHAFIFTTLSTWVVVFHVQDLVADFMCSCPPGYTGKNCSVDINECLPNICPGNSTCTDDLDSYTCTCNLGFEGGNCTGIIYMGGKMIFNRSIY